MLSTRSILQEIRSNDDAYRLFLSVAAKGEAQGGWENERLAERTADAELSAKIARHGQDELKHARLFSTLLRKRGMDPVQVPLELDYTMLLTRAGLGVSHDFLAGDATATEVEIIAYLVHGRVTEQRGAEEIDLQMRVFRDDSELGRGICMVADDEVNHLSHCHEELLRFARNGHADAIRRQLEACAKTEIRIYRDVSAAMTARLGEILAWPAWKRALIRAGIHATYLLERAFSWRRMVKLRPPERPNALGQPLRAPRPRTV